MILFTGKHCVNIFPVPQLICGFSYLNFLLAEGESTVLKNELQKNIST